MYRKWRRTFWRWHRRVGISALAFLAVMALTGIVLNHANGWGLYEARLPYWLANAAYADLDTRQVRVYDLSETKLEQLGADLIFNGARLEAVCELPVSGLAAADGVYWIGCGDSLIGITKSGQFVERLSLSPLKFDRLTTCDGSLCIFTDVGWQPLDLLTLELGPADFQQGFGTELAVAATLAVETHTYNSMPPHLRITPSEFNLGRLIADIHSGAVFKAPGKLLVDLLGLVVLFLAATGCYLWLGNKRGPGGRE